MLAAGTRAAKAVVGEAVGVLATIVGEGHDAVGANVVLSRPDGTTAAVARMGLVAPGTDRLGRLRS